MAVTIEGKTIKLTAATDEVAFPVCVKKIRWVGAGTGGDDLIIHQSSAGDTTKEIWRTVAAGANNVESELDERMWNFGFRIDTLDAGEVYVHYK